MAGARRERGAQRWCRLCWRRSPGVGQWRDLRAGSERHSRLAGAAAGDRHRRGGCTGEVPRNARHFGARKPHAPGSRMTAVTDERQRAKRWLPQDAAAIAEAARRACVLEVSAPKPGNVSPDRPFADVRYDDFVASAEAIRDPLTGADVRPLGETILMAVEATARVTRANTNLGIVLLLAPLARAASRLGSTEEPDDRLTAL